MGVQVSEAVREQNAPEEPVVENELEASVLDDDVDDDVDTNNRMMMDERSSSAGVNGDADGARHSAGDGEEQSSAHEDDVDHTHDGNERPTYEDTANEVNCQADDDESSARERAQQPLRFGHGDSIHGALLRLRFGLSSWRETTKRGRYETSLVSKIVETLARARQTCCPDSDTPSVSSESVRITALRSARFPLLTEIQSWLVRWKVPEVRKYVSVLGSLRNM